VPNFLRKFNFLSFTTVGGSRVENLDDMKSSIHGFYKVFFSESRAWRPKDNDLSLSSLSYSIRVGIEMW